MDTTDKVLVKLNVIRTIFISAFNNYQAWKYLRTLKDEKVISQVDSNQLFKSYDYFLYFNTIIELAKLLENKENTQKNNLHLFLLKIQRNLNNSDYSQKIDIEFVNEKNKELEQLANSIEKVSNIRNRYYAHTEKNFFIPTKFIIGFDEFNMIFDCIESIITKTHFLLTGISDDIKDYTLQKATECTLRELVKFHQLKCNPEIELWRYYD
jgi:hypothetical protein